MSLSTYSDLQTSVANYLGRSDLTSQIPDFISLAELRLSRDIRTRRMLKTSTATMTVGDPTVGLPSDFLSIRDVFIQGLPRTVVSYLSPSAFLPLFSTTIGIRSSAIVIAFRVKLCGGLLQGSDYSDLGLALILIVSLEHRTALHLVTASK